MGGVTLRCALLLVGMCHLLVSSAWAQMDADVDPRVEVGGSIQYSMSANSYSGGLVVESRSYAWALQPSIGVFLWGMLELSCDIRIQRIREEEDLHNIDVITTYHSTRNRVAVLVGPGYNLPLRPGVWAFFNAKAGLHWEGADTWSGFTRDENEVVRWSENRRIFPVLQGGFKAFLGKQAAVVIQLEYNQIPDLAEENIMLGLGLVAYL